VGREQTGPARLYGSYALLRVTVGVVFLFAGVGKFVGGVGEFSSELTERFGATWLPDSLVALSGPMLPFVEVALGGLLVLVLLVGPALLGAGTLMLILTFGTTVVEDHAAVGRNVVYALSLFVLVWLADGNRYSLDAFIRRRREAPAPPTPPAGTGAAAATQSTAPASRPGPGRRVPDHR
jgi:thiosulfate dehydrogenase (quinone) large subunit